MSTTIKRAALGTAAVAVLAIGSFATFTANGSGDSPCDRVAEHLEAAAAEVATEPAGLEKDASLAALEQGRAWVADGCPADIHPGRIAYGLAALEGMDAAAAPSPPGYSNVQSNAAAGTGR